MNDNIIGRRAHNTNVAGVVAAIFNNSKCAHGVAYNAKISGIIF